MALAPLGQTLLITSARIGAQVTEAVTVPSMTPTPSPTLSALTLAASSIAENSAAGTVVGGILGKTASSTLSLADNAGGRFAISGTNIVAGATVTNYEGATSHNITIRETLAGATNTPRDTVLAITVTNVNEQANLSALALSGTSYTIGASNSGSITGATAGSTINATGLPSGLTIDGAARTWAWSGSGSAGSSTVHFTETLADSANSPRDSDVDVTVVTATVGGIAAPFLTPQANPLVYPPTPDVDFLIDANAPRVGDKLRVMAGPNYDGSALAVNDATYVIPNISDPVALKSAINGAVHSRLAGITSGAGFVFLRAERGATLGDVSIPVQYGTNAVPALTSGSVFTVRSGAQLAITLTYATPVKLLRIYGEDMAKFEIVGALIPGTSFTLRWLNNVTRTFEASSDFNLDNIYNLDVEVVGFNGVTRRDAISSEVEFYDITPDSFAFADTLGATRSTQYNQHLTSPFAGVADDYDMPLSLSGPWDKFSVYDADTATWGSELTDFTGVTVREDDDVKVWATSSASYATDQNVVVTAGGVSATWLLRTMADPTNLPMDFRQYDAQAPSFDNYVPFTGITTYTNKKHIVGLTTSAGAAPPATLTLDGTAMTKEAQIVTGTITCTFWECVITTGGTGKSLVISGGGNALSYGLWTTNSTGTYVDKVTRAWAGGADPQVTTSLAKPANGAIIYCVNAGAPVTSVDAPGVQDAQINGVASNGYSLSFGHLTATGALSVRGPAFSNAQLLAVSYQP